MSFKNDIVPLLCSGLCEITFTKKDGTERTILATLMNDLIPVEKQPKGASRVHSEEVQPVYEVELDEWRSFRWDSVISFRAE